MTRFPLGITPDTYKDRPALRITTKTLSALFLPEDGATDEVWYRILRVGFHDENGVQVGKWFR